MVAPVAPVAPRPHGRASFQGRIAIAAAGTSLITRSTHSALRMKATPESIRRAGRADHVVAIFPCPVGMPPSTATAKR